MSAARIDLAVVGAGAAGLMAAIQAARAAPEARVLLVDGQARLGAKILISGGGRCNVTHDVVTADAFAGSTRPAIRKVLKGFGVAEVVRFYAALGVELKREETGKLFPVTNRARTVLDALLRAADEAGVERRHPLRVMTLTKGPAGFELGGPDGTLRARRVIVATGGRSVVETGSDGHGYVLCRALGHSTTPLWPGLVPLCLPDAHPLTTLRGVSVPVRLELRAGSGRRLVGFESPLLCTHFGISGPAPMDISRYWLEARAHDAATRLGCSWLPGTNAETLDRELRDTRGSLAEALAARLPARLVHVLIQLAGVAPDACGERLRRDARRNLGASLLDLPLPVTDARGWRFAEVTAGGVPLSELRLPGLESRRISGLFLCGEICDVDGQIGGFNFQWAWASGTAAGRAAAASLTPGPGPTPRDRPLDECR